jgi:hypothetical protein
MTTTRTGVATEGPAAPAGVTEGVAGGAEAPAAAAAEAEGAVVEAAGAGIPDT